MDELEALSERGRRRVFRVLCYLAHADDDLDPREGALLDDLRRQLGIDPDEAGALEDQARRGERLQLKPDDPETDLALRALADVMLADGVLHPKEAARLKRIAGAVGVSDARLAKLLRDAMRRRSG